MASQKQEAKEGAILVQAGRDIRVGPDYNEVRQIALDVFQANFEKLSAAAAKIAMERAGVFVED